MVDDGVDDECNTTEYDKFYNTCDVCRSSDQPRTIKKVSSTHVNDAFDQKPQIDLTAMYLIGDKFEVLNMIDTGARYGERVIAPSKNVQNITDSIETSCIYHLEAPKRFSSDPVFC